MADINEFTKKAIQLFESRQEQIDERFNLNLSRKTVENFIKSSFYASLIADEERWPNVCLMCYKKEIEKNNLILFNSPIEISANEIAKLSHAVADDCNITCISDDGKLSIVGIEITRLHDRTDLGYSSFRTANPLKLVIIRPGHIEMSSGGSAIVYKSGVISEEHLLQYRDIMDELISVICEKMQLKNGQKEILADIFNDIAKNIVKIGHGGILLIANESSKNYFSSFRGIDSLLFQKLLIRYWQSIDSLLVASGGVKNLLKNDNKLGNRESLIVSANTEMLEKCTRAIAQLSGMDGAIAMNYECKIFAFNSIINKLEVNPNSFKFIDKINNKELSYGDVLRDKGSRHQSALTFVMKEPNSFAFVISQDGFVSVFHNQDNKTIMCEQGMRVLE